MHPIDPSFSLKKLFSQSDSLDDDSFSSSNFELKCVYAYLFKLRFAVSNFLLQSFQGWGIFPRYYFFVVCEVNFNDVLNSTFS